MSEPYMIRGRATGKYYLVVERDARTWVYPPGAFAPRAVRGFEQPWGFTTLPTEGIEVSSRWPWLARRRVRRYVERVENRVARSMRTKIAEFLT